MASGTTLVVLKALGANLGITCAKFVTAIIARSSAMLSEAVHSLADTGNQVLLLIGMNRARRDEDSRHEFGYGSERYFWAFIVAVSLFTMGATFSIYEGIHKIANAGEAGQLGSPIAAYVVLGISILLESYSMSGAIKEFQHFRAGRSIRQAFADSRDAVVFVVMFEDAADLAGLLIALIGLGLAHLTGSAVWDGVASIAVGLTLAVVASVLATKTRHLLIGEAVTPEQRRQIIEVARTSPGVRKIIHLRTMHLGPEDVICAIKVAYDDQVSAKEVAGRINEMEERLRGAVKHLTRIYVEVGTVDAPQRPPATGPTGDTGALSAHGE